MENKKELVVGGLPMWVFIIPPIMLLLSNPILPWPHGYYQLLRLIVCGAAMVVAFSEHKNGNQHVAAGAALIALIYNPVLKIDLDEAIWTISNFALSGLWIYFLWGKGLKVNRIMPIFGIPLGVVVLAYVGLGIEEFEYRIKEQQREARAGLEREKIEKINKKEKAEADAVEKKLFENAEKIDLIKFELIQKYESSAFFYTPKITIKNRNNFSINGVDVRFFFVNKDALLVGQQELTVGRNEKHSKMEILEASATATIPTPVLTSTDISVEGAIFLPEDADFQRTKIKIIKAYKVKPHIVEYSPEEIEKMAVADKEMESATELSKN